MDDQTQSIPTAFIKVDRITDLEKVAEGGVAEIHRGANSVGLDIAVRKLKPSMRFKFDVRRAFLRGIATRKKLGAHPNVVRYLGQGGRLRPYEVIEYVPGETLKTLILRQNHWVVQQPESLLLQAASALVRVHERGFIHLDIKPENYLVLRYRDQAIVKLSDFDTCLPASTREIPAGFASTTRYLAPEFFTHQSISAATDYFAFGVLAYNLFTGQMPYSGPASNALVGGRLPINYPDDGSTTIAIRDLITRCMCVQPEQRFQNDAHFWDAVNDAVEWHSEQRN